MAVKRVTAGSMDIYCEVIFHADSLSVSWPVSGISLEGTGLPDTLLEFEFEF